MNSESFEDGPFRCLLPTNDYPVVMFDKSQNARRLPSVESIAVFPGSFNPLHRGHLALKVAAERFLGRKIVFELSVSNAEKPMVAQEELRSRIQQFAGHEFALTNSPFFRDKAALFPRSWFVVGIDTAQRIVDPGWYENSEQKLIECFRTFRLNGHRFLVGGRIDHTGFFCQATSLVVPESYRDLFVALPESEFREDISSTQIRESQERNDAES